MSIKSTIKSIFESIALKLGITLHEKTPVNVSYIDKGLNPTVIGANVVSGIAIDDSEIAIEGSNARAEALRELLHEFTDDIEDVACEISLGTGDAIVRPYTDGNDIGFNVVDNNNFIITEAIGSKLKGIIIKLDEFETESNVFRLFETQTLKKTDTESLVYIKRFAYKDEAECDISTTIWKDMVTEENIIADQLLLGRYKCPTINRDNVNSANGVPITFGCEDIVQSVITKYNQYNDEFDRKQAKTFADRTMFQNKKGENTSNKLQLSDGQNFVMVTNGVDGGVSSMIQDYSPAIRSAEFESGINLNLSILELCCGFSRGVFTTPETSFATATEMKNSLKKTFAFVKKFRRKIESGNKQLFHAIDIIMNINNTTPMGEYEIVHKWSNDYIEDARERFNQLVQGHSVGAIKTEDVTAYALKLNDVEAKQYVEEIQTEADERMQKNLEQMSQQNIEE